MNCWKTVSMQKNFGMLYILPNSWPFCRRSQRAKTKAKRVKVGGVNRNDIDDIYERPSSYCVYFETIIHYYVCLNFCKLST